MIDHVTIQVSNLNLSRRFYELAFSPLGYRVFFGNEGIFWAFNVGEGCLFEIAQYKGQVQLTPVHIAFRVQNIDEVRNFYQAAIKAGGKDNGAPGPRPQYTKNYYACFILDLDEHNIEVMWDKPLHS